MTTRASQRGWRPQYRKTAIDSRPTGFRFPFAMPSPQESGHTELSHLLAGLVAFLDEHRYCGELDGGAEDEWTWMTCTCGAVISRTLEPAHRP
jgi:hypothetical protein